MRRKQIGGNARHHREMCQRNVSPLLRLRAPITIGRASYTSYLLSPLRIPPIQGSSDPNPCMNRLGIILLLLGAFLAVRPCFAQETTSAELPSLEKLLPPAVAESLDVNAWGWALLYAGNSAQSRQLLGSGSGAGRDPAAQLAPRRHWRGAFSGFQRHTVRAAPAGVCHRRAVRAERNAPDDRQVQRPHRRGAAQCVGPVWRKHQPAVWR